VEEITERRNNDPTRTRDAESSESLSEHDAMNRALLATYACITALRHL
jgi:adenylate kinase